MRETFALGESRPILDAFFHLTYVRNTGAAWGLFGGQNVWLAVLSIVVLALMVIYRRAFLGNTWEHRVALGLLAGGIGKTFGRIFSRIGA